MKNFKYESKNFHSGIEAQDRRKENGHDVSGGKPWVQRSVDGRDGEWNVFTTERGSSYMSEYLDGEADSLRL